MTHLNRFSKQVLGALVIMLIFGVALYLAQMLSENEAVVTLVETLGYIGVLITGIVAGLNTFVPLPAATFTPIFVNAGLSIPLIIVVLAIGTLIADAIGFALGYIGREMVETKYPKLFNFFTGLARDRTKWIIPVVVLYAAFVPFPNEAILIPLALAGVRFKLLLIPLIVGNIIHQTWLVLGVSNILAFFS